MARKAIILIFVFVFLLFTPQFTMAEGFGGVYLGWHDTHVDDMEVKLNGSPVGTYPDSDSGSIFGGRIGFWSKNYAWLGLAVDASVSQVDFGEIDIGIGSASVLVMARLAIKKSKKFPRGKIQPYAGVGPGIFFGGMSEFIQEIPPSGAVLDDSYFSIGLDARVGLTFLFNESYGIFLEYAFKRFTAEFSSDVTAGTAILEPTLSTNSLSLGMTFRF